MSKETQFKNDEKNVAARYKVNGILYGKEVWVLTDCLRVAQKVQLDAECDEICSNIYEWTDDGWTLCATRYKQ